MSRGYDKINPHVLKKFTKYLLWSGKMLILPYLFAILKCVIYGSSILFTGALTESLDVLDVLALRFLMSFVVLWIFKVTGIIKIKVGVKDIFGKTDRSKFVKHLLLAALFEPILYMFFETLGISMVSGVTAGVVLSLQPVSSVICESVFLKERSGFLKELFLFIGIVGVAYISICTGASEGGNSILGIVILVGAVITSSLFQTFSRKSSMHFRSFEITYFVCMLGAVVFNGINVIRHIVNGSILNYFLPYTDAQNMIGFVFLAVVSTIIAACMNNYAIARMQITTMSAFGGISTITTVILGVIFDAEPLYYYHYIGMSLIIIRMVGVSAIAIKKDSGRLQIPKTKISAS